jgi:hypothetical protein
MELWKVGLELLRGNRDAAEIAANEAARNSPISRRTGGVVLYGLVLL